MYRKNWLIPIVVLLFCSFAMISYQRNTQTNTYATPIARTQVNLNKNISDITEIAIEWSTQTIKAKRTGSSWEITSPRHTSADGSYIYDIIHSFIAPGNLHLIAENVEDPTSYGIDTYSTHITLYDMLQGEYELIQGKAINTENYYAYNPKTFSIYAVPKKSFDSISKDLSRWYDKNYIQFDPAQVKEIVLAHKGVSHLIIPTTAHNQITFSSTTLPTEQVDLIINFLTSSRVKSYVVDNASAQIMESYGFNADALHFKISSLDGTQKSFALSTSLFDDASQYVLLEGTNTIITIPKMLLQPQK